ncbi:MAG: chemotaxis protein CheB [Alphaproteobacteria bacterium]
MAASQAKHASTAKVQAKPNALPPPTQVVPPHDMLVVAVGASAGGLDAFRGLVRTLPANGDMAFILVQHLDPNHESLLVELLASCTSMPVHEARQGMRIAPGEIYVIPPGAYLALTGGAFQTSEPQAPRAVRLPFDFLLRSLAAECGERAVCVVLSGTGTDGTIGLQAISRAGGFVIVQDPQEAGYDGMPQSAVSTGVVDLVIPLADMMAALVKRRDGAKGRVTGGVAVATVDPFAGILDVLRQKTSHDFRLYKPGTLNRRIERRMGLAAIKLTDVALYRDLLERDAGEVESLAKDLLINVTSFFRDPQVFDYLAAKAIPELIASHPEDQPVRVWIAGCSTGEEAFSVAILLLEAVAAAKRGVKLQIFASDVDEDAVAIAREGFYPESALQDVSRARVASFFVKEDGGYRVSPALRATLVFTVHDVLADAPFSRLDMVSCRNLLIYLGSAAQAKVISLFHFALRPGGVLLLGKAETVGRAQGQFEPIAKAERLYRQVGRSRPGEFGQLFAGRERVLRDAAGRDARPPSRQSALAELCRQQILANFTPAAALVTARHECLYMAGPAERYLRVPPGHPTHDILAMAPAGVRAKLRSAIHQASETLTRVSVDGGRVERDGHSLHFSIEVQPVKSGGETLFLVCFVEHSGAPEPARQPKGKADNRRVTNLKHELEATKTELRGAILDLELSSEEQKAINEDALSVNEEFQSANEELLTSKEELQSLNEELTALNGQLQETLERQRTTADDLQNVLYSTDLATLFLDGDLKIRFFTPATKLLFNIIPGDVGRPLSDLKPFWSDDTLSHDAQVVLKGLVPVEKEIETESGAWFVRRILPYRAHDGGVEGVVVTFTDITERIGVAKALEAAKQSADQANLAKTRFLAVASHDLRQPLQALALQQGLLAKIVQGDREKALVSRLAETLGAMSGMLNTLLDINQIESGALEVHRKVFPVNEILERLKAEFSHPAQAKGLELRKVRSNLWVDSDPLLLEQMIRNLLANALKYTKDGKVLLGCRRRGDSIRIEILDSGVGIAKGQLQAIFEEYHQIDNPARERSQGLGLGLSIVQRLGDLLHHQVHVASEPGKGSVFCIEIARSKHQPARADATSAATIEHQHPRTGAILLVEDDPDIRELFEQLLQAEGHTVAVAADGQSALDLLAKRSMRPDLLLADFNLPGDMNGLELVAKVRDALHSRIPVAILTGDISSGTLHDIARNGCVHLSKPVKLDELNQVIQGFLSADVVASGALAQGSETDLVPRVYVVDDDDGVREAICSVLEDAGWATSAFSTAEAFLKAYHPAGAACLLLDAYLPGMGGLELLKTLAAAGHGLPTTMITGNGDIAIAVEAMKAGAMEFIEKPIAREDLLAAVTRAIDQANDATSTSAWHANAIVQIASLTGRQRQIMELVLAGHPSKNIAADLGISQRTVENHRAAVMKRTGVKSLPELARLAVAAD